MTVFVQEKLVLLTSERQDKLWVPCAIFEYCCRIFEARLSGEKRAMHFVIPRI